MPSPTIIQQAQTASGSTVSLTSVSANSVLVNSVSQFTVASATVSSMTGGGTWAQVPGVYMAATGGTTFSGDVWRCAVASGGSTTVTTTWSSSATHDHHWLLELTAASALDGAATGVQTTGTTLASVPCADAGALLIQDTVQGGAGQDFQAPWTTDGRPNGNPTGHYYPGAAGSYAPTVAVGMGTTIAWGASFAVPADSPPRYNVDRGGLEDILREGILSNSELRSAAAWF